MPMSAKLNKRSLSIETRLRQLLRKQEANHKKWLNKVAVDGEYTCPFTLKQERVSSLPDPFPAGASEQKLDNFTRRSGIELSASLRKWLMITNGASGFLGVRPRRSQDGIEKELANWISMKENRWLPVARDECGNRYVQLVSKRGKASEPVCYAEMIGGYIACVVASDMLHFAEFYLEDQLGLASVERQGDSYRLWPNDRTYTVSKDPRIEDVEGLPFPWT